MDTHEDLVFLFNESQIILHCGVTDLDSFLLYFFMDPYSGEILFYPLENLLMVGIQDSGISISFTLLATVFQSCPVNLAISDLFLCFLHSVLMVVYIATPIIVFLPPLSSYHNPREV